MYTNSLYHKVTLIVKCILQLRRKTILSMGTSHKKIVAIIISIKFMTIVIIK